MLNQFFSNTARITTKEFGGFFSSPIAFIFLGAFLLTTLFVFFWVETFFSRNISDVRPLFEWMPVLLIFLVAALTMRMWSEERRSGTLEFLLTMPVSTFGFVTGKFLACTGMVAVALLLTIPVPITISIISNLDWGPVFGAYIATLFLGAAYIAIGLYISARNDNQIVSLILTVLVCGLFYLVGSSALTGFFGNEASELMKLLGSGSRFESITRGVIDLRDLYYYLSIMGIFLSLNIYALEKLRWSKQLTSTHTRWRLLTGLIIANFIAANLWLQPIATLRTDVTQGKQYSISEATHGYLARLQEPLLIRGYFSAQTHPLLSPLVPQLRDLIKEYAIAGQGKVRVEFIDPLENPELEQEAGQKYGIRPVPFQMASKYQASVVNSYFDVVIEYGDQHETLGFQDLIEVKAQGEMDIEVTLRNPEYDLTRSIKKVLYSYQASGNPFSNIPETLTFRGYISPDDKLPAQLVTLKQELSSLLQEMKQKAGDKLVIQMDDPDAKGGELANMLQENFGFRPMATSLLDTQNFWFYMTIDDRQQTIQIPFPNDLDSATLKRSMDAALKRFSSGFLKNVAIHTPKSTPHLPQFGMQGSGKKFTLLKDHLRQNNNLLETELKEGHLPEETDLLLLVSPENLDEQQLFAIDQFLMQGGTVILASSSFDITTQGTLGAKQHDSGLETWLQHHGITLGDSMVLDPVNAAFPVPVERNLGGFTVQEIQMVEYPYFVDIREQGMNPDNGITAGIPQVTLNWASPISIDEEKNRGRKVTNLLHSSSQSWTSDATIIQPDFQTYPEFGFAVGEGQQQRVLATIVEGRFDSYFKGKTPPLSKPEEQDKENEEEQQPPAFTGVIEKSPDSARIILFASNNFLSDEVLNLASSTTGTRYLNPAQLIENAVDWSLEDRGLLSIRSRSHYSRTLPPMDKEQQMFWEYLNYGMALLGLLVVYLLHRTLRNRTLGHYRSALQ